MADEVRLQSINNWVGIGVTSSDDMLIYLYDENPALNYVIAYIYEEEIVRLPQKVQDDIMAFHEKEGVNKYLKAPLKSNAESDGWMHPINPPLKLMVGKGKRVDWAATGNPASHSQPAQQAASSPQAGQPAQDYIWNPLESEQWKKANELASDIAGLQWVIAKQVLGGFVDEAGIKEDDITPDMSADLIEAVYRGASYEFAKEWPAVRGALRHPVPVADFGTLDSLVLAIKGGEPEDFLQILADNHPLIIDADFARVIMQTLGEKNVQKDGDKRAEQAKKAALYIELTSRHDRDKGIVLNFIQEADEQIPF